jgi:hypothetical protein
MTLDEFIDGIDGFNVLGTGYQILAITWYMEREEKRSQYTEGQIIDRFDRLRLPRPATIGTIFADLCEQTLLLRSSNGYYSIERSTRSKLDAKYGQRPTTIVVQNLLAELPAKLTQAHDRAYLDEALICFKYGAFRAAIVMAWNLAFDHLCTVVETKYLPAFNAQLPKTFQNPRIPLITKKDDFAEFKESNTPQRNSFSISSTTSCSR